MEVAALAHHSRTGSQATEILEWCAKAATYIHENPNDGKCVISNQSGHHRSGETTKFDTRVSHNRRISCACGPCITARVARGWLAPSIGHRP